MADKGFKSETDDEFLKNQITKFLNYLHEMREMRVLTPEVKCTREGDKLHVEFKVPGFVVAQIPHVKEACVFVDRVRSHKGQTFDVDQHLVAVWRIASRYSWLCVRFASDYTEVSWQLDPRDVDDKFHPPVFEYSVKYTPPPEPEYLADIISEVRLLIVRAIEVDAAIERVRQQEDAVWFDKTKGGA